MAPSLATPPKDLTQITARYDGRFPKAKILSLIDGYAKSDLDRADMPEFGALLQGDEVPFDSGDGRLTPTPGRLVALLEYLQDLQQPLTP